MSPNRAAVLRDGPGDRALREHLVAAAAALIAERGTAGVTVREIARAAQVSDGVLYNHFADRDELLALALTAHVHAVEDAWLRTGIPDAGKGTVAGNLRTVIDRALRFHAAVLPAFAGLLAKPGVFARMAGAPGGDGTGWLLRDLLTGYLAAERDLGRIAADANVEMAATMIIGACHGVVLPHLFGPDAAAPSPVPRGFAADLAATVLAGIAPTPGSGPDGTRSAAGPSARR